MSEDRAANPKFQKEVTLRSKRGVFTQKEETFRMKRGVKRGVKRGDFFHILLHLYYKLVHNYTLKYKK